MDTVFFDRLGYLLVKYKWASHQTVFILKYARVWVYMGNKSNESSIWVSQDGLTGVFDFSRLLQKKGVCHFADCFKSTNC